MYPFSRRYTLFRAGALLVLLGHWWTNAYKGGHSCVWVERRVGLTLLLPQPCGKLFCALGGPLIWSTHNDCLSAVEVLWVALSIPNNVGATALHKVRSSAMKTTAAAVLVQNARDNEDVPTDFGRLLPSATVLSSVAA